MMMTALIAHPGQALRVTASQGFRGPLRYFWCALQKKW